MSTKVQIRLPIPEGKPGEEVTVSDHRADALIRNGYATSLGKVEKKVVEEAPHEGYAVGELQRTPGVVYELPDEKALKAEWIEVAESLGIETEEKTKAELIAEVQLAVGG